jgi:hypothetical protein
LAGSGENSAASESKNAARPSFGNALYAASASRAMTAPETSPPSDMSAWQSSMARRARRCSAGGTTDRTSRLKKEGAFMTDAKKVVINPCVSLPLA